MSNREISPIVWKTDRVMLIDQTKIPQEFSTVAITSSAAMAEAIETMIVRGAPAIGIAAAFGLCLGAGEIQAADRAVFLTQLEVIANRLKATRPTAVNLFWAIDRMMQTARSVSGDIDQIRQTLILTAQAICDDDVHTCKAIGDHGLAAILAALPTLKPDAKLRLLTHCNTGALATGGYGTALGIVRSAWRDQRLARLYADETRPRGQGAKLTAWECVQEGIPVTVITDSMAAHCMQQGMVDAVVVGADRIARNGDTANKIGTYSLAIVAKAHHVPFFVAAPRSTIDFKIPTGQAIEIEQRDPAEIYQVGSTRLCPEGAEFYNPAFDVTPANLITGIVTEFGTFTPEQLNKLDA
jgi:methylthioribose-1-phosphate isomerase